METSKFDIADYLDSNEMIAEYLNAVLAEGNDSDVIIAIGHIAKSIGMTKIAQETGKFVEVRISNVPGKASLDNQNLKKFKKLVEVYRDDIIRKWVDFFVFNKAIEPEHITKKL